MVQTKALFLKKPDFTKYTEPESLELGDKDVPTPKEGEVLVKVKLRPVNPADIFSVQGVYPGFKPPSYPAVPGLEGMGFVEQVGPGVTSLKQGQRVHVSGTALTGNGTWQEHLALEAWKAIPVPEGMSDDVASQITVNPVTIFGMLEILKIPEGEFLLQSAASSTLGRMMIEAAKHYGIRTINIVRRKELEPELKALGADFVIDGKSEDLVKRVLEITSGKGAYGAIDPVAGESTAKVMSAVREGGQVLLYGAMGSFDINKVQVNDVLFRYVTLRGFWLNRYLDGKGTDAERRDVFAKVIDLLTKGVLTPHVGKRYPLSQYKEALEETVKPGRGGKVFLES